MSDAREDLIDAIEDLGTDELREVLGEVLSQIITCRSLESHSYPGVKVPLAKKAREQMARSLTDAIQEWAGGQ